jgi:hypothetical protein
MTPSAEIGTTTPSDTLHGETLADPGTTARATTVLLSRGGQTYFWGRGDHVVFVGDVSGFRTVRIVATASATSSGLVMRVEDVEDPAVPIVLEENTTEQDHQELRTVLDVPGRRLAVVVWVDEEPPGPVQVTWGIWGRA